MTKTQYFVVHSKTNTTLGIERLRRDARMLAEDEFRQGVTFGDNSFALRYETVEERSRQIAYDPEEAFYTGLEIIKVVSEVERTKRTCCQCGRVGTRGFTIGPAKAVTVAGIDVNLAESAECTSKAACRRRWPKRLPEEYL